MLNTDQTSENKVPKTITLDPVVNAWVSRKVGIKKLNGEKSNDSSFINDLLRAEMEKEAAAENGSHLEKFTKTKLLKKEAVKS